MEAKAVGLSTMDPGSLLFIDCQTTGMHPSTGHLLELAWKSKLGSRNFLLRIPEGNEIPYRVSEIAGIRSEDLEIAVDPEVALSALEADLNCLGPSVVVLAHYAQFESAFLSELNQRIRGAAFSWRFLCTFKIARLLFPEVPSRNIRALVGHFELGDTEIRRALQHVEATEKIWWKLESALEPLRLEGYDALDAWLRSTKAAKPAKIEFRMDRLKRLQFPERPGIYRMLGKSGKVLYVGKATSLHSRVNSYFRGKKGQGKRKREMLAQVLDIQITECESALEAALLENEEIKRLDPPYNVSLKAGNRSIRFLSRNLAEASPLQTKLHPLGPFGVNNSLEVLGQWLQGERDSAPEQIFHDEISPNCLREGNAVFLARHRLLVLPGLRKLVALGMRLAKEREALLEALTEGEDDESEIAPEEAPPVTAEDVSDRIEGLIMRAAWEYLRAKRLTKLLNCRVRLEKEGRVLQLRGGRLGGEAAPSEMPWEALGVVDFDRMSVLLTEINRHSYPVEWLARS